MEKLTFFKKQVCDLKTEKSSTKSEAAYLKGQIKAYEWFLKMSSFIKGDNHA